MRDELQPRLALDHLADYELPRKGALLYRTVRVLGTKAQVLTYLGEIEPDAAVAHHHLDAAATILHALIDYLTKNPETAADLPREHNYLGAVYGAQGALEPMDRAFGTALELNDRWFETFPAEARDERRDDWIDNLLFTFQLWLRYSDLAADDDRFDRVDRRYEEARLRIAAATGRWDAMQSLEGRYPAALIARYRARAWARRLEPLRGSPLWRQRVSSPLASLREIFEHNESDALLAAAILVDQLLSAAPAVAGAARELHEFALALAEHLTLATAASRRHWRRWEQDRDRAHPVYREPLADELRRLRAFIDGRLPWPELESTLRHLRVRLGY
jgi:hypothetical protein